MGKWDDAKLSIESGGASTITPTTVPAPEGKWPKKRAEIQENITTGGAGNIPTNSVMTKLAEPSDSAEFGAMLATYMVDDVPTKIKILSERMNIPAENFGVDNGQIVYDGGDGKLYPVVADKFLPNAANGLAKAIAHAPSMILGTAGAAFGPAGAALGAGIGEGVRKLGGNLLYDEPQTLGSNAKSIAAETALAAAGDKVFGLGAKGLGALERGLVGKRLNKVMGRDLDSVGPDEALAVRQRAKEKYDIDMDVAQSADSDALAGELDILGNLRGGRDLYQIHKAKQAEQVQNAIGREVGKVGPVADSYAQGGVLKETGEKAIRGMEKQRTDVFGRIMAPAKTRAGGNDIELQPDSVKRVVSEFDNVIKKVQTSDQGPLIKLRNDLIAEPAAPGKDLIPETNFDKLHRIKMSIDDMIKGKSPGAAEMSPSSQKFAANDLKRVKKALTDEMSAQIPEYPRALRVFQKMSGPVDKVKKSSLGAITKKDSDIPLIKAVRTFFDPGGTTATTVAANRAIIQKENPLAWDASLATYLSQIAAKSAKKSKKGGRAINPAGNFYQDTFGNVKQREILEAGMSKDKFDALEEFVDILRKVSITSGKESGTATRQLDAKEIAADMGGSWSKLLQTVGSPFRSVATGLGRFTDDAILGRNAGLLVDAMTNPENSKVYARLKGMPLEKLRLVEQIGTGIALAGGALTEDNGPDFEGKTWRQSAAERAKNANK